MKKGGSFREPRHVGPRPSPPEANNKRPHRPSRSERKRRRLRRWAWRALAAGSLLLGLGLFTFAGAMLYYGAELPDTSELDNYNPPQVTRILARDGSLLAEVFIERRTLVPIETVPEAMKRAVLAAEDAHFYEHEGLNYLGILRALIVNLRAGRTRQGGSTITQQVVKNVLLTPERTFARKIRELILARRIEQELSKDQILGLYLNRIYFGHGRYGIEEAARYYFGKTVSELELAEAALLAGIVKGPSIYSPRVNAERALQRRTYVLSQMGKNAFAPAAEVDAATKSALALAPLPEAPASIAPEMLSEVQRRLEDLLGPGAKHGGFSVTTTLDPALQRMAREAVRSNLDAYVARHRPAARVARPRRRTARGARAAAAFEGKPVAGRRGYNAVVRAVDDANGTLTLQVGSFEGTLKLDGETRDNPEGLPPSRFAKIGQILRVRLEDDGSGSPRLRLALSPESALVALDARSAEVLAMVGGYEVQRGGFNRALSARRQPASAFKPIVYSHAIHSRRFSAASLLETDPNAIAARYRPRDHGPGRGTPLRLREALAQSLNVPAVWTLEQLGPGRVVEWARALGIRSKLGADLSLALGAYEVTALELLAAYTTFAAGGVYREPRLIRRIVRSDGRELEPGRARTEREVLDPASAFIVTSLLRSVVTSGTARQARALPFDVVGKTGTSNAAKDAWFVGYSPRIACVVWTGFDDAAPLGKGETGASAALPAFIDFMKRAHGGQPAGSFEPPRKGLLRLSIDASSGGLASPARRSLQEFFLAGTEPTAPAPAPGDQQEAPQPPRHAVGLR
ncbi:MAG: PBP1A family penicillin-binding protein [Myxococcales bacterium]|nr:PBP1A family penicillin-binding protein [Myxococcales bacterium]